MKTKRTTFIVQSAMIVALYAGLTIAQAMIFPQSTSMAVQFRVSEVLTLLALFTPNAITGLTIGCAIANIVSLTALPPDMIIGPIASFLAAFFIYKFRNVRFKNIPILSALMPALFNGIIIGLEIEIFFIAGDFNFLSFLTQGSLVALGELGVCLILGLPLVAALEKTKLSKKLFYAGSQ